MTLRFLFFWGSRMPMDRDWGTPGDEAVSSMISSREMRPKDRAKEGVIQSSWSGLRLDSGVLVCRL